MSLLTRYCQRCGRPIKDGTAGHTFGCPPPEPKISWPPTKAALEEFRRLASDGNDHAAELLATAEHGKLASPEALNWYIDRCNAGEFQS